MSTAAVRRGTLAAVTYATKGHIVMPKEPKGPKTDHRTVVGVSDGKYYSFTGHGQLKRWLKSDLLIIPNTNLPANADVQPLPEDYTFPPPVKKPKDA
jgi:hypothetical protein